MATKSNKQAITSKVTTTKAKVTKLPATKIVRKSVKVTKVAAVKAATKVATVPTKSAPRQVVKRATANKRNIGNTGTASNNNKRLPKRTGTARPTKQVAITTGSRKSVASKQGARNKPGRASRENGKVNVAVTTPAKRAVIRKSAKATSAGNTVTQVRTPAKLPTKQVKSKTGATRTTTTRKGTKGGTQTSRASGSKSTSRVKPTSGTSARRGTAKDQTRKRFANKGGTRNFRAAAGNVRARSRVKTSRVESVQTPVAAALMPQLPVDLMEVRREDPSNQLPLTGETPCFGLALRNGNKIYLLDRTLQAYSSSNQPEEFQPFTDLKSVKTALAACDIQQVLSDLHMSLEDHGNVSIVPIEMRALGAAASIDMSINWKPCHTVN